MGFLKVHLAKKSSVVQFENTKEFRIFKEIEIWHVRENYIPHLTHLVSFLPYLVIPKMKVSL